ncbi:hypothetical protein [Methylophilus sp. Leaf408]|uniref:hypothetical protein n=1 Tax=Methylophilus sp. Leaf408 TaxID=2876561 RepID=UPI001E65CCD7|nr:hypothetical protein [Methylophilus sp. Leaf408]
MKYYVIEPEVAGGLGERTVIDRSSGRIEVKKLHYHFDGWLGDELLESTPCFIVSTRLANEIENQKYTGVMFSDAEITTSDEFNDLHENLKLPDFLWLKVFGVAGKDDFGMSSELNLVVSEPALQLLKQIGISHAASIREVISGVRLD